MRKLWDDVVMVVVATLLLFGACGGCIQCSRYGVMPSYSEGTRIGELYKFSHKGVIWKSYEGEMLLNDFQMQRNTGGNVGNVFAFSVIDETVAKDAEKLIGKRVKMSYQQWLIPPMTQSTSYTVISIEEMSDKK